MSVAPIEESKQRPEAPLELVEFELALDVNDISSHGFCDCVQRAAQRCGAHMLFQFRTDFDDIWQQAAAVAFAGGSADEIHVVLLDKEGRSLEIRRADELESAIGELAKSFAAVSRLYRSMEDVIRH